PQRGFRPHAQRQAARVCDRPRARRPRHAGGARYRARRGRRRLLVVRHRHRHRPQRAVPDGAGERGPQSNRRTRRTPRAKQLSAVSAASAGIFVNGKGPRMIISKHALPRRTVLRGLGSMLALPLLDSMMPALSALQKTAARPINRFGVMYVPNGMIMQNYLPR